MPEVASLSPELTHAVESYLLAMTQHELAEAQQQRIADLAAASEALRALTQAAEELNDRETDAWSLHRRYPELLAAHQATWRKAFRSSLDGHFTEMVREKFAETWRIVFLPVLLDRSDKSAGNIKFGDTDWVRIFGTPRQQSKSWSVFCSDKCYTARITISLPVQSTAEIQIWLIAAISKRCLRSQAGHTAVDGEPDKPQIQGKIYDYSPINEQDLIVSIEAMRDIAASVDYMKKLMTSSARAFANDELISLSYIWKYLYEKNISTADFHRAVTPYYQVTKSSIEMARARYRRARQEQATPQSARERKTSGQHSQKTPSEARKKQSPRREVHTP